MYGSNGHAQARWFRSDIRKNLWKPSEEYMRYSREEKRKLVEIVGLEPSPDTAVFSDAVVKQVDVPTSAGMVGVLANHVPTIGVLKPGVVSVTTTEGSVQRLFVSSGTLSVNIDGSCQVLAEEVLKVEDIDESAARAELESAQRASGEGSEVARAEAQGSEKTTEYLESLKELTLTSKLTHMTIRNMEAEEVVEKEEAKEKEKKEEAKEKEKKEEAKEKKVAERNEKKEEAKEARSRSLPPRLSVHQFINILNPYVHASIPREQCIQIDELLSERGLKRKNESMYDYQKLVTSIEAALKDVREVN
ncbi:hypothetical protein CAEBREN_23479 [Caenorhabditis brenneri]|uniref:ATP synthase F1 complex delta/epsilon subunit N-terminal domain-containing protein n=1 Tax=Caenorhabditis brenneri TaxID=135651 RepID=G0PG94_CAEBE|nr:hypothetical protein CAEBREN_23479 [Caenorhabditis brenneri]